jgi:hypothetical protein
VRVRLCVNSESSVLNQYSAVQTHGWRAENEATAQRQSQALEASLKVEQERVASFEAMSIHLECKAELVALERDNLQQTVTTLREQYSEGVLSQAIEYRLSCSLADSAMMCFMCAAVLSTPMQTMLSYVPNVLVDN